MRCCYDHVDLIKSRCGKGVCVARCQEDAEIQVDSLFATTPLDEGRRSSSMSESVHCCVLGMSVVCWLSCFVFNFSFILVVQVLTMAAKSTCINRN